MIMTTAVPRGCGADDEGSQPLDSVDQALARQEIQRPVDRGRRHRLPGRGLEPLHQRVGAQGPLGLKQQAEDKAARRG